MTAVPTPRPRCVRVSRYRAYPSAQVMATACRNRGHVLSWLPSNYHRSVSARRAFTVPFAHNTSERPPRQRPGWFAAWSIGVRILCRKADNGVGVEPQTSGKTGQHTPMRVLIGGGPPFERGYARHQFPGVRMSGASRGASRAVAAAHGLDKHRFPPARLSRLVVPGSSTGVSAPSTQHHAEAGGAVAEPASNLVDARLRSSVARVVHRPHHAGAHRETSARIQAGHRDVGDLAMWRRPRTTEP